MTGSSTTLGKDEENGDLTGIIKEESKDGYLKDNHQFNKLEHKSPFKMEEMVRILIQEIRSLGFNKTAQSLENESGILYEPEMVVRFRIAILEGRWAEAETILENMELLEPGNFQTIQFLIREQKYIELLEERRLSKALNVLQNELEPLHYCEQRLHRLSSLIMCTNMEDLRSCSIQMNHRRHTREELLSQIIQYVSPSMMLPDGRLETLLKQAFQFQILNCPYHNSFDEPNSLYVNHQCPRNQLPSSSIKVLKGHSDEVWYVSFSNCGKNLASASKDNTAIIWGMPDFSCVSVLRGHSEAVSFLSWSPDDSFILTCGNDKTLRLWSVQEPKCEHTLTRHTEPVTCCAWTPDGQKFVSGGLDKNIFLWARDGRMIYKWSGHRITDLCISKDGEKLIAVCHEKKIRAYCLTSKTELFYFQESDSVTSLSLSQDGRFCLVNISSQELHMWDLKTRRLLKKYFGQKQGRFVIRSCFGGANEQFIASGSEDAKVYMWHRHRDEVLLILSGHTGTVNSVSWSPTNPCLIASASDDRTIRIWGCKEEGVFNGVMECGYNSKT